MPSKGGKTGVGAGSSSGAWQLDDADDPADWTDAFAFLREMDASLRCELCYNILTAPVAVKDCNHVFCSVCVRNAINQPDPHGHHCPKCMTKNVHDSSLVSQPLIERTAEAWKKARPELVCKEKQELECVRESSSLSSQHAHARPTASTESTSRPSKRTRIEKRPPPAPTSSLDNGRRTRSGSTRQTEVKVQESIVIESDTEGDDGIQPSSSGLAPVKTDNNGDDKDYRSMQASDMVECPSCTHTFTLVALNQHLDKGTCQPGDPEPTAKERGLPTVKASGPNGGGGGAGGSSWFQRPGKSSASTPTASARADPPRKKLARPNYSFLKEVDVRKMLDEYRLATTGAKERLVERHRQWVTLFNANLDASEAAQKSELRLRKDLAEWERGQEEGQRKGRVMTQERARTWEEDNREHFRALEKRARESHLKNKAAHQHPGDDTGP